MAEDLGEKTEDPTSKRLADAREKGQIARSADLSAAVLLSFAAIILFLLGPGLFDGLGAYMRAALEPGSLGRGLTPAPLRESVNLALAVGGRLLLPIMLIMAVAAWIEQVAQVGWNFTLEPISPKIDRLSPIKGVKNIFSRKSVVKAVVNIGKLVLIAAVAMLVIQSDTSRIVALPALTPGGAALVAARLMIELALWILAVLLFIGFIDRAYQVWQHKHDLRMTKHEVKDERKSTEGDAETKARRQRIAREIMRQRLRGDVPKADVIVTNPTHYAVAIKYDPEHMSAPKVLAKGADHMAMQIRLIASGAGVPIVERPALARALYRSADVGREIPVEWYEAVAEVLAYVYRLDGRDSAARAAAETRTERVAAGGMN